MTKEPISITEMNEITQAVLDVFNDQFHLRFKRFPSSEAELRLSIAVANEIRLEEDK